MKFFLDGIEPEDRDILEEGIKKIIREVFDKDRCNVTEIHIPVDYKSTINRIYSEKNPGKLYFEKNDKREINGKAFNYKDDIRIIINKSIGYELIAQTLYHELVHALYYKNIENYEYLNSTSDDLIDSNCRYIIDEYNAYKKTFLRYFKSIESYLVFYEQMLELSETLDVYEDREHQLEILNKYNIYDLNDYVNKIVKNITIGMAIVDIFYENGKEQLFNNYIEKYKNNKIIIQLIFFINSINEDMIPNIDEFNCLRKYIEDIELFYEQIYYEHDQSLRKCNCNYSIYSD